MGTPSAASAATSSPEVPNGKAAQVEILRKEHTIAVSKFDFERAELIDQQIKTL
jgi:hypothetical protein